MTNARRLAAIRTLHTAIYLVNVIAILMIDYAGVTGRTGRWLTVALVLAFIEVVVFVGSGMKCPLTAVAVRYGAGDGPIFDTFLPEPLTRNTLRIFAPLLTLGLLLLAARWLHVLT
ncbi:MAG: hypothetical protein Q7U20_02470 [Caulobacter sp.]|nr:hypothetical protein [Caulobacter sp.]